MKKITTRFVYIRHDNPNRYRYSIVLSFPFNDTICHFRLFRMDVNLVGESILGIHASTTFYPMRSGLYAVYRKISKHNAMYKVIKSLIPNHLDIGLTVAKDLYEESDTNVYRYAYEEYFEGLLGYKPSDFISDDDFALFARKICELIVKRNLASFDNNIPCSLSFIPKFNDRNPMRRIIYV